MIKRRKIAVCISLIFAIIIFRDGYIRVKAEDIYNEQYKSSGFEEVKENLPKETRELLERYGITAENKDWLEEFTVENVFSCIADFIKSGGKKPVKAGAAMLGVLLLQALCEGLAASTQMKKAAGFAAVTGMVVVIILPIAELIAAVVNAVEASGVFMMGFIPVFAGMLLAMGKTLTSTGFSAVMLTLSEMVSQLAAFVISPVCGMYLALGVSSSLSQDIRLSGIGVILKKSAGWLMSLLSAVFLGVLGVQNCIGKAADGVATKAVKFVIGSSIPIVGTTVSESLTTVKSCLNLLGSTAGIYAVIAVAVIVLPIIIELLLWRLILAGLKVASQLINNPKSTELLTVADGTLSLLLGVILFVGLMFLISVTLVTITGGIA